MAIVDSISRVADWLNANVCPKIKLKVPATEGKAMDDSYEYQLTNPAAFPLYMPASDRLPPGIRTEIPSICVQVLNGEDRMASERDININLGFSCWNPGNHEKDIYYKATKEAYDEFLKSYFPTVQDRASKEEHLQKFRRTAEGWMDLWNFIDLTIRELEQVDTIEGIQIVKDVPIKFGPYKEQDSIPDFYPMWFGYVQLTIREGIVRNNDIYREFL